MTYRTFTILIPPGRAEDFVAAVKLPATTSEEYDGPLGLGENFAPDDPTTQPGVSESPNPTAPAKFLYFHSTVEDELVDRLERIVDGHGGKLLENGVADDLPNRGIDAVRAQGLDFLPEDVQ